MSVDWPATAAATKVRLPVEVLLLFERVYHQVGGILMTTLLQQAFAAAALLSASEQDALARRLLDELAAEQQFDDKLAATGGQLTGLAALALAEHQAGETVDLDTGPL